MSGKGSYFPSLLKWATLGLLLANVWTGWTCWIRQEQTVAAQAQVQRVATIAEKIKVLRRNPVRVEQAARTGDAIARIVESAAKQVNLNPDQIVRIDPGETRQLGDLPYVEQRTDVEVRESSLQRIIELAIAIEDAGVSMDVPMLSLRVPSGVENPNTTEELWNAQILLTSRIYQPKIPARLPESGR